MPELSEASVYAALGLNVPQVQGANEQEPAAPDTPAVSQNEPAAPAAGANDQGVAAPENGSYGAVNDPAADPAQDPASFDPSENPQTQSAEERRANAARRRQAEQQAAIDAAVAAARQEEQQRAADAMRNLFARAGMRNTFTGEPITTQEQFDAWQTRFRNEQLQNQLAEGKLTIDSLNALVDDHPVVKQAREVLAASPAESPAAAAPAAAGSPASAGQPSLQQNAAAHQAADTARIQAELAEIAKLDPTVRDLGDILNSPTGKEFYANVQKGYSFIDSFRLANFERLTASKAEAARQQAVINDRGKGHMTGAGNSRGSGSISVPAADMDMFRTFNPNASEADIQAFYNKFIKGR